MSAVLHGEGCWIYGRSGQIHDRGCRIYMTTSPDGKQPPPQCTSRPLPAADVLAMDSCCDPSTATPSPITETVAVVHPLPVTGCLDPTIVPEENYLLPVSGSGNDGGGGQEDRMIEVELEEDSLIEIDISRCR